MTAIQTYYVKCEHADFSDINFDLIVRAADEADALVLWKQYYDEELVDQEIEEPEIRLLEIPNGRGAVSW